MALTDVKSEQIQSSVALAGSPTTTTQSASDNSTKIATTAYVETAVANLVASAPSALNTLDELAAALNDDASFSTTVTNSIATKLPLAGGTLSGLLTAAAKIKLTDTGNATVAALQITDAGLGISSPTTDQMNFITADATRAVIDANGKVGIGSGATSPGSLLHVDGANSGGPIVTIHQTAGSSSADSGLDVETSSTGTYVQRWINSGTELARVTGTGRLGIGTTNPTRLLSVVQDANDDIATFINNDATNGYGVNINGGGTASGRYSLRVANQANSVVLQANANGDVQARRARSNTAGQVALSVQPSDSTIHYGFRIDSSTNSLNLDRADSGNEAGLITVKASGDVGIGTTSPANRFVIKSGTNCDMEFGSESGGNFIQTYNRSSSAYGYLRLITGGSPAETMRLDANGRVGIGTSSIDAKLHIEGNSDNGDAEVELVIEDTDTTSGSRVPAIIFKGNGSTIGRIRTNDVQGILMSGGSTMSDDLVVTNSGVGIGTTSIGGLLTIRGTGDAIRVESTNAGAGGAQLDLLHHTASPADDDTPGSVNFGGYYSGTTPAYSAAIRSIWKDVSAREGKLVFLTRNAGNFNTNMEISHNGIVRVAELADMNATGAVKMHRYNIGALANYTGNLHQVTHAGIDHYEFTIQGNDTYQDLFNNVHGMGFELYIQLGDAASRDHALYSVNATSPAYGVSTFTQVYYNNGGWNTGSFALQMIGTPGNNSQYTIQVKFASYYNSSNNATGYVQIRRLY